MCKAKKKAHKKVNRSPFDKETPFVGE